MEAEFIKVHSAAKVLQIAPSTLYAWIHKGTVPVTKSAKGDVFLIRMEDFKTLQKRVAAEKTAFDGNLPLGDWAGEKADGPSGTRRRRSTGS